MRMKVETEIELVEVVVLVLVVKVGLIERREAGSTFPFRGCCHATRVEKRE